MPNTTPLPERPSFEQLQKQAKELLRQYRSGDPGTVGRFAVAGRSHAENQTLAAAQFVLAREYGFDTWAALKRHVEAQAPPAALSSAYYGADPAHPTYRIDWKERVIEPALEPSPQDWDAIFAAMKEHGIVMLNARGRMTDDALERLSRLDQVTHLNFDGSNALTDDGLAHLARLPRLQGLDLSGPKGNLTDRGLAVLSSLSELRRFSICWQPHISDAGLVNLVGCEHLESVNLMGTPGGDDAIAALAGKPALRHFKTGRGVTDAGIAQLHRFPVFKTWQGGEPSYSLMSPHSGPNSLLLDGPFTDTGLASLAGLDGVFGLGFFWHSPGFTSRGLASLKDLANLGFLGCQDQHCDDEAMRHIAAIPRLRMLMGQGAVAGDSGWRALSRSQTIEYIWGRECPNLGGRGFAALAAMPALRGLAVSLRGVGDEALAALPEFPALRELMPMDVPDAGFRHVGRCHQLEALWCMYCRDTGDAATEHLGGLSRLKSYYAGRTRITDRSLEVLARLDSLERLEFWECGSLTNAGLARLARLPRLREIHLAGLAGVTREAPALFPARVRVNYTG
jgi:hypothetical protein